MKEIILMCIEFFKTGLFAVGGGMATIPFLQEMANKYGWFTTEDLSTMIAVSESTPGPIGVNMSTYVGNTMYGFFGGILATLALVTPSVIVICIIAKMLKEFKDSKTVQGIFTGLRPAVVGLVLSAMLTIFISSLLQLNLYKTTGNISDLFNIKALILFALLYAFYKWKNKLHPIFIIMIAAGAGIIFGF